MWCTFCGVQGLGGRGAQILYTRNTIFEPCSETFTNIPDFTCLNPFHSILYKLSLRLERRRPALRLLGVVDPHRSRSFLEKTSLGLLRNHTLHNRFLGVLLLLFRSMESILFRRYFKFECYRENGGRSLAVALVPFDKRLHFVFGGD